MCSRCLELRVSLVSTTYHDFHLHCWYHYHGPQVFFFCKQVLLLDWTGRHQPFLNPAHTLAGMTELRQASLKSCTSIWLGWHSFDRIVARLLSVLFEWSKEANMKGLALVRGVGWETDDLIILWEFNASWFEVGTVPVKQKKWSLRNSIWQVIFQPVVKKLLIHPAFVSNSILTTTNFIPSPQ